MALIKCPECGKEISDKASSCPSCGCPISSNEKLEIEKNIPKQVTKRKLNKKLVLISIIVFAIFISGIVIKNNIENQKRANYISLQISALEEMDFPEKNDVMKILDEYNSLSSKQKEMIVNYNILEKYMLMDLELMHDIQNTIDDLMSQNQPQYLDIKSTMSEYEKLTSNEKQYIKNIDNLNEFLKLSEYDKAGIVAVNFLKSTLKNPSSLEIENIRVKKEGNYYVVINYLAQNSFGGVTNDTICVDVSQKFKSGLITLSILTGKLKESSKINYNGYIKFDAEEIYLDAEKIMDNIDAEIENVDE